MEAMLPLKESNITAANVDYTEVGCSLSKGSAIEEDFKGTKELVDIKRLVKESEEEEIEFGFERVVENLDQHRVHCPNCHSCITKVVLRKPKTVESLGLFGCLSCFTIFIPQGNGFNLSRIFQRQRGGGNKGSSDQASVVATNPPSSFTDDKGIMGIDQRGTCFDLFRIFKNDQTPELISAEATKQSSYVTKEKGSLLIDQQERFPPSQEGLSLVVCRTEILTGVIIERQGAGKNTATSIDGAVPSEAVTINIEEESGPSESGTTQFTETLTDASKPIPLGETNGFKALEILKSIVYGGLMESITSLSVVSSAAASDATTVTIVAMGLANLIGGLFIIGPKIRELKNDHSEGYSYQRNGQVDRYQELLGQRENFLLHATVAVLSFLIFGLIPPLTYGFSFRQSDDKDLKLGVVAAASLTCIVVLAIGKAYIQKPPRFSLYIKTVLYYVSMAVMASGISYAVGDLVKRLMEKFGWFDSTAAVTLSFPCVRSVNPAWGSY
ncbi:vacuolar iron transporter (VIT) family protein [Actinidia rufa]|uniref:Vacuolar iron transporter (VIT) family protein n=1 Tax=Actinidia rufa TaxID=165716 RepID=A0A7J0FTP4_9ERIC|nr:vacuolar iron transporter (VIT) family protein [Actinidia rufa]